MRRPRSPGFTLLELLAALAVLAVLASLSFRGLSSVLDGEAHVREEARRWSEVGFLLGQLREDITSAMEARGLALGSSAEAQLVLTRFADEPAAPPRRVGYRLREGTVEYLLWAQGREAGAPPAAAYAVLANVAEMRISALAADGTWVPVWPAGSQTLPRALAVELALASGERVTRLFALK
jgi:general secretion pathway protein J